MTVYAAFDLHSSNSYLGILDEEGKRVYQRKLANNPELIQRELKRYGDEIAGIAVESTYNWYWLVDMLMEKGYRVHLANPSAIKKYSGLKHSDDKHDAYWLAEMLRLKILPEGYIYPKEERPVRDLLRKRGHLVKLRRSLLLSLENTISRSCGVNIRANDIKCLSEDRVSPLLIQEGDELAMVGEVSKKAIDFLTRQIKEIEKAIEGKIKLREEYRQLLSLPGVGKVLALTIMLETGDIRRFKAVGNYVSYCRKVNTQWTSNGKTKGRGNKKNGNKFLAWAFSEAAELARRYDAKAKAYFNRKLQKTNRMIAHQALAHKLARAAFYLIRDKVPFMEGRVFR
jgi:transposase